MYIPRPSDDQYLSILQYCQYYWTSAGIYWRIVNTENIDGIVWWKLKYIKIDNIYRPIDRMRAIIDNIRIQAHYWFPDRNLIYCQYTAYWSYEASAVCPCLLTTLTIHIDSLREHLSSVQCWQSNFSSFYYQVT